MAVTTAARRWITATVMAVAVVFWSGSGLLFYTVSRRHADTHTAAYRHGQQVMATQVYGTLVFGGPGVEAACRAALADVPVGHERELAVRGCIDEEQRIDS